MRLVSKSRAYIIWPSTIGTYNVRSLPYLIGNAPTVGQGLYIAVFVILNVVLTSVNYQSRQPNAWYSNQWQEIMAFVFYRTGVLAYVFAPLVFLFAGRNNILLWLTNWSHSTYLLLHRWVARVFAFQALLHSVLALVLYINDGNYAMEHVQPYWIWGIVATICTVVLTFGSGLHIRRFFYESFLVVHIVICVILIAGCYYHAYDLYGFLGNVEAWIYAMAAVWAFDRFMRIARLVNAGVRRAKVSALGNGADYIRVDIPGVRWSTEPGKHAYFYFPTLTPLRPWENHPFSVLSTALLQPSAYRGKSDGGSLQERSSTDRAGSGFDLEKRIAVSQPAGSLRDGHPAIGLTLFIKKGKGITKILKESDDLLTLVEGPYPNNSTKQILLCNRLLLIGGGIGITGLVPFVHNHWNVKLCWSVKPSAKCLIDELGGVLDELAEKEVSIGRRLNIGELLAEEEAAGWARVGVVVSGPAGLCDDVRAAVIAAARRSTKTIFELEVEAYSW